MYLRIVVVVFGAFVVALVFFISKSVRKSVAGFLCLCFWSIGVVLLLL